MNRHLSLLLLAVLLAACSDKAYDISDGINKEITLFGDEISVPIGSIGPLTVGSTLDGVSQIEGIGGLVAQYIKEAEDGSLVLEDNGSIFKINVYELEKRLADAKTAQTWDAGFQSGYIGGMAAALGFMGINPANQKLVITASNPLFVDVPAVCSASYSCMGSTGYFTSPIDNLTSFTMAPRAGQELLSIDVPADVTAPLSTITISSLSLDLPADPVSKLYDKNGNLFFSLDYKYTSGISVGESFSFPLNNFSPKNVALPIGQFKLSKCEVSLELESSIPLRVEIDNIRVLKHKESADEPNTVDENIKVGPGVAVAGGSLEKPATTPIKLTIEALEGTIPDIEGLMLDLKVSAEPGIGSVAITSKQGVILKSSSAKISGGITIPQK